MSIRLGRGALDAIRREAARAYPHEACGALLGSLQAQVSEAFALPNQETARAGTRFTIAAADYLRVEQAAEARGAQLLGFWHSHPDHPARPSATDREHVWEGLLTVVVSVLEGEPCEITAWSVPGPGLPFAQVPWSLEQA